MMTFRGIRLLLTSAACLCAWALTAPATAQTFNTIINVPPEADPGSIGSDTQLNLFDDGAIGSFFVAGAFDGSSTNIEVNITGGVVGHRFDANSGSTVNISGGVVGDRFDANSGSTVNISGGTVNHEFAANSGSTVNISGGTVDNSFDAFSGSTVNISGGTVGVSFVALSGSTVNISGGTLDRFFNANSGSTVNISGGEFFLNGVPIPGLDALGDSTGVNIPSGSHLTVTLTDGTVRTFGSLRHDNIADAMLTLINSPLPVAQSVVNVPSGPAPMGLRTGQTLNLSDGGALERNFTAAPLSTVNINGGLVGGGFIVGIDSTVNITGGNVGNFDALSGSTVNISGGDLDHLSNAHDGSTVNITGGNVGVIPSGILNSFNALSGSTLNISGGSVGPGLRVFADSTVNITGGKVSSFFSTDSGSTMNISGGEFFLDGAPLPGLNALGESTGVNLPQGSRLTVTLSDGTLWDISSNFPDGTLNLISTPLPTVPSLVNVPADPAPQHLRTGQTLNLNDGGVLGNGFAAAPLSTVNIKGGTVGVNFVAYANSTVNISGGNVDHGFSAFSDSTINISGGTVGGAFNALSGSTVNISGGSVGSRLDANPGSMVNISGGTVASLLALDGGTVNLGGGEVGTLRAHTGSTVNISGGIVSESFDALTRSGVNIFGRSFILDGIDLTASMMLGDSLLITDRDITLEGLLTNGDPFSFDLNSTDLLGEDFFHPNATLTITLVPEPGTLGLIGIGALCAMRRRMS